MKTTIIQEEVSHKIYFIRNQKVMLDKDLAALYQVETRRLNEQVKRNSSRFPEDFMFQLTEAEYQDLMSQNAISSWGGTRKLPYAFSEHGILMLSSVLNSEKAVQTNIQIMRLFAKTRKALADNAEIRHELEKIKQQLDQHGENIGLVFQYLDQLLQPKTEIPARKKIGYKK